MLQVSADETVRFAAKKVLSLRTSRFSFMPEGLLDGLEGKELADLVAYLKTLK